MVLTSVTPGVLQQLRADHPVLQRAQIFRRPGRLAIGIGAPGFGIDRVHEDLAQAGGDWAHLRLDACRQVAAHALQALATSCRAK
jgi:hypothetical protein